jgi:hypothetical protein
MRELVIRIERNGPFFDMITKNEEEELVHESITTLAVHKLLAYLLDKAIESLD